MNRACSPKPNFFIVGAPRCATSSIHRMLGQQPDIYMCDDKEPHYLASVYGRYDFWKFADRSKWCKSRPRSLNAYERLFERAEKVPVVGESSTNYLYFKRAVENIRSYADSPRILICLRNPIERAFSEYRMIRNSKWGVPHDPADCFDQAVSKELSGSRGELGILYRYVEKSRYAVYVERYLNAFPKRVKIVIFEELRTNPENVLREILSFLGVQDEIHPVAFAKENVGDFGVVKSIRKDRIIRGLIRVFRQVRPDALQRPLLEISEKMRIANHWNDSPSSETFKQLQEIYAPNVSRLESMLGMPLMRIWKLDTPGMILS